MGLIITMKCYSSCLICSNDYVLDTSGGNFNWCFRFQHKCNYTVLPNQCESRHGASLFVPSFTFASQSTSLPIAPSLFKPSSFDREGRGEGMYPPLGGRNGGVVTGMAIGKTAGGPRAEKEGGGRRKGRDVGMREVWTLKGGQRRKYFSASAGGKGSQWNLQWTEG